MEKLKSVLFKAACFYSCASLVYLLAVALFLDGNTTVINASDAYMEVFEKTAVLFLFSLAFGASFMIFDVKKLPSSAKRIIHAIGLYIAFVAACFFMASVDDDLRKKVMFVFIATFFYVIIYCVCTFASFLIRKRKNNS